MHHLLKMFYLLASIGASLWSIWALRRHDPKDAVLLDHTTMGKVFKGVVYILCAVLAMVTLSRYNNFTRRYIEKIVYNTQR
jgi:hypothetical protein